jgi:hypothetical protein
MSCFQSLPKYSLIGYLLPSERMTTFQLSGLLSSLSSTAIFPLSVTLVRSSRAARSSASRYSRSSSSFPTGYLLGRRPTIMLSANFCHSSFVYLLVLTSSALMSSIASNKRLFLSLLDGVSMSRGCKIVDGGTIVTVVWLCMEVATLGEASGAGVVVVWAFAIHFAFTRLPWPAKGTNLLSPSLHWSLAAWRYIPLAYLPQPSHLPPQSQLDLLHSWFRHASLTSRDKVSLMTVNELGPPWAATTVQGGSYCPGRLPLSRTVSPS